LPDGKRREGLASAADTAFETYLRGRILPFDSDAAEAFAELAASRRQAGRPISQADAQIAAIAASRGADLATRNVADFEGCGVQIINPWGR
jgi:predicted nucleic acid-binding protein